MIRTRTIQGELLTVAAKLKREDTKVDLVMCSPPYEAKRRYAELAFNLTGQAWVDWAVERFVACLEVCRGPVVWVVGHGQSGAVKPWTATPALLMADLHRRGVHLLRPVFYRPAWDARARGARTGSQNEGTSSPCAARTANWRAHGLRTR
jgi:hypothetical protein